MSAVRQRTAHVLFIEPRISAEDLALLAGLALAATLASSLVASAILRRLKPTELLREA